MGLFDQLLETSDSDADQDNIPGVAMAVVKENWDNEHPGMVKVEISLGAEGKNVTDWAPVIAVYAGKEYGTYFLPEIGTQVLVAFHMGNINCPIVIGCLWNQEDILPPETANEKNTIKRIRTKEGNQITISDENGKESIAIETKGKLKFLLDDENKKISFQDEQGENSLTLDAKNGEFQVVCKKKASFEINGKEMLILDGNGKKGEFQADKINIEASQELKTKGQSLKMEGSSTELKGQNIKIESQAALNLKGTASLKAESSGISELKGSMVKIN